MKEELEEAQEREREADVVLKVMRWHVAEQAMYSK